MKCCVIPELFVVPLPLIVSVRLGLIVIVNALAPGLNKMVSTSVFAEKDSAVIVERLNVAVSVNPLGGPPAVQFPAEFQSPEIGSARHAALPAKASIVKTRNATDVIKRGRGGMRNLFSEKRGDMEAQTYSGKNRAASFITPRGTSGRQRNFCSNGLAFSSTASAMISPSTGANLNPWPLSPVAMINPRRSGSGAIQKSPSLCRNIDKCACKRSARPRAPENFLAQSVACFFLLRL